MGVITKAGRELDEQVALKVMGYHKSTSGGFDSNDHEAWFRQNGAKVSDFAPPPFSTEIPAAWRVVEKMYLFHASFLSGSNDFGWKIIEDGHELRHTIAEAATAPLVICLAALKIVEERQKPPQVADNMVHLPCSRKPDRCNNCTEYVCRACYPDHDKTCAYYNYSCPVCHQKACGHFNEPKL